MEQQADNPEQIERYTALCDRAVAFVENQGGTVAEDVLIDHVFGSSGSTSIWRPLLRTVLESDERVIFRANGEWFIPNIAPPSDPNQLLLSDFIALDVETTGLKPSRNKIIEIALLRFRNGVLERRYESLLNPGRKIPDFITRLTTIRNEDVADAPEFADVAQDVLDFIGDDVLIGHNVGFDIGFINAELDRVDRPLLMNERIDTMGLAMRLLNQVRKPSLDHVATAVGLSPRGVHRAAGDARLTAEVAMRLMEEAANQGIGSVDRLKSVGFVPKSPIEEEVGRARVVMDRSLAQSLPKKPGVYIMRDAHDEIIYVGKAKNLRTRVNSYYSELIGKTRKMDGLIESVARIDHEVVGSELEALLLESQLIRRYLPRYNTALKRSEFYPYIKVDVTNPYPRVRLVRQKKDDGARYFGPYTSSSSAKKTVDVINGALPLRTCTRSFKNARSYGNPCLALDLKQCTGPCTGKVLRENYQEYVDAVLHLLDGKDDAMYQQLHQQLEDAAESLNFERADRIRKNILNLTAILGEQQRTRDAEALHNMVLVLPGTADDERQAWLILHGRLWARFVVDTNSPDLEQDLSARIEQSLQRISETDLAPRDHHDVDEAGILVRFLFRNEGSESMVLLTLDDDGKVTDDPANIAARVLAVDDTSIAELDVKRAIEPREPEEDNLESKPVPSR